MAKMAKQKKKAKTALDRAFEKPAMTKVDWGAIWEEFARLYSQPACAPDASWECQKEIIEMIVEDARAKN